MISKLRIRKLCSKLPGQQNLGVQVIIAIFPSANDSLSVCYNCNFTLHLHVPIAIVLPSYALNFREKNCDNVLSKFTRLCRLRKSKPLRCTTLKLSIQSASIDRINDLRSRVVKTIAFFIRQNQSPKLNYNLNKRWRLLYVRKIMSTNAHLSGIIVMLSKLLARDTTVYWSIIGSLNAVELWHFAVFELKAFEIRQNCDNCR